MNIKTHKNTIQNHAVSWIVFPSNFNGKEKDWESGFHYYGARYYWSEVLTGWLSVDPMMDKYPNISPYAYCNWNPVVVFDPDGRDGVKIINESNKTITVKASYYVCTSPITNRQGSAYNSSDVETMQNDINGYLNSQGFTHEIGDVTYSVKFDLCFSDAGDNVAALQMSGEDYYGDYSIGNMLMKLEPEIAPNIFSARDYENGKTITRGGVTSNNHEIIMNSKHDNTRRQTHEVFHTLFFNNDNADKGIGNYVPGTDMPNQNDIKKLLDNPQLPALYE